jgi:hypothetical protein
MKIECPFCKQPIEFPDEMIGQWTDCPSCLEQIPLEKSLELKETKGSLAGLYQNVRNKNASETPKNEKGNGLRTSGVLLLIGGLLVAVYCFLFFDTSVESAVGPVNNIGLMADRQNGIIVGIGIAIIGTILFVVGSRNEK